MTLRLTDWCIVFLLLLLVFGGRSYVDGPRDIVVVEETADRTPEYAALWTQLQTELPDHRVQILEVDSQFAPDTQGVKLPAIIISDPAGNEVYRGTCPTTLDAVRRLIE